MASHFRHERRLGAAPLITSHPETFDSPLHESACLQTIDVFIPRFGASTNSGEDQANLDESLS